MSSERLTAVGLGSVQQAHPRPVPPSKPEVPNISDIGIWHEPYALRFANHAMKFTLNLVSICADQIKVYARFQKLRQYYSLFISITRQNHARMTTITNGFQNDY